MWPATLEQLAGGVSETPRDARSVVTRQTFHPVILDGDSAIAFSCVYTYVGVSNIQGDVVDKHAATAYLIELDMAPSVRSEAEASFANLLRSWSWSS